MIEVEDLNDMEIKELIRRVGYAHLACCRKDEPYLVPVHYAYANELIYVYTTEGKKSSIIRENPKVCLQIEDVIDNRHWQSVIVDGVAEQLKVGDERISALAAISESNPGLTPAVSIRWMDNWVRENIEVIYKITPTSTSGRRAVDRSGGRTYVPQSHAASKKVN